MLDFRGNNMIDLANFLKAEDFSMYSDKELEEVISAFEARLATGTCMDDMYISAAIQAQQILARREK